MSDDRDAIRRMINDRSVLRGEFVLTSGRKSSYYIDGRMTTLSADGAAMIGRYIFEMIRGLNVDAVGGPTIGADPMATAVSLAGYEAGQSIDAFIVRSDRKQHGTMRQIEGTHPARQPCSHRRRHGDIRRFAAPSGSSRRSGRL